MLCPGCGQQLDANTSYCPQCRFAIRVPESTKLPDETMPGKEEGASSIATPELSQVAPASSLSGSKKNTARHRQITSFVVAVLLLIAVTVAANVLRSNIIYQNSLLTPSNLWTQSDSCMFGKDGYHLLAEAICRPPVFQQDSFRLSIEVKDLSDGSQGHGFGLLLVNKNNSKYVYSIDSIQGWQVFKDLQVKEPNISNAIHSGLNVTNALEIRASNGRLDLYVNGSQLDQINDPALSGMIPFLFNTGADSEVVFTNIKVTHDS